MRRAGSTAVAVAGGAVLGVFALRRLVFMAAALVPVRGADSGHRPESFAVVVPARDEAATIERTLSYLAAAHAPAETYSVTLVDDGSTDGTAEIMEAFAAGRTGWSVVRLAGAGKAGALNAGLAASPRSELVATCDADVRLDPGSLVELAAAFADPEVAAASGLLWPGNDTATTVARYCSLELWQTQLVTSAAKERLGLNPPALGWLSCYRRHALDAIDGFREGSVGEDVEASNALTAGGWRTRFVAGATVRGDVPERLGDYYHQHVRWGRAAHGSFSSGLGSGPAGGLRRVETWMLAAGYFDRVALAGLLAVAAMRRTVPALPIAYLAVAGAEALVSLHLAGVRGARMGGFVAATIAMFPADVATAAVGSAGALAGRRTRWRSPRRLRGGLPPR
ncbi:MAG: 1,2-diacylglycerol 3-beta-glucosyltransferase [Thermoleophilaceae bacterium]|nr:1,2-diacylglycerol 3-beta-glucosyltransferase [Thermoleophilaceae bacterium]